MTDLKEITPERRAHYNRQLDAMFAVLGRAPGTVSSQMKYFVTELWTRFAGAERAEIERRELLEARIVALEQRLAALEKKDAPEPHPVRPRIALVGEIEPAPEQAHG